LSRGASADELWSWGKDKDNQIRLRKDKDSRVGDVSLVLVSASPAIVSHIPLARLLSFAAVIILLVLAYLLVRFVARHFFLLDQAQPQAILAGQPNLAPTSNTTLLQPPMAVNGDGWDSKHFHRIDLSRIESLQEWTIAIKSSEATQLPIVLDHFEHRMYEPSANYQKLQAIEQFLSVGRRVIVVSTVDPLRFSLTREDTSGKSSAGHGADTASVKSNGPTEKKSPSGSINQPTAEAAQGDLSAQTRWWSAFSTFVTVYARDNAGAEFVSNNPRLLDILKTSQPWRYLETIGDQLIANAPPPSANAHDPAATEEQINQVIDQALAYHQALWATCSQDERCALIHLALDGMITSKNTDLRQLMKRGLVVRDPALRLMDESFRRFVISASRDEDIDAWREAGGGSAWQLIKVPLLLVLLSVAVFLFVTQKELYDSTISFVSALTAGIAILFRFLGMFQKGNAGAAPQG
jgi:energy-coupling factor transporter transmembrane protein EcfT